MNQEMIAPFRSDMMTQREQTNGRVSTEESFIPLLIKMDEFKSIQFPVWAYGGPCACGEKRKMDTIRGRRKRVAFQPFGHRCHFCVVTRQIWGIWIVPSDQRTVLVLVRCCHIKHTTSAFQPVPRVNYSLPPPYRLHH